MDHSEKNMEWTTSRTVHSEVVTSIADSSKQESRSGLCSSSTDTTLSVPSNSQMELSQHTDYNTSSNVKSTTQAFPMRWIQKKSHSDPTPMRSEHSSTLMKVFQKNYATLVNILPMQSVSFQAELFTNGLMSVDLKNQVNSKPLSTERAALFLDKAIMPSIVISDSENFKILLKVMENSDDEATVRKVGITISSMLRKELSDNETDEMDISSTVNSQQYSCRKITAKPEEIELVRNNLCCSHKKTRYTPEGEEWPPCLPKSIVSVALIYYKGKRTQEQHLEIAQLHKGGSIAVDELITSNKYLPSPKKRRLDHSKISKKISDIFQADFMNIPGENSIEPFKFILIEGAPGIGKTVLIKEIAYCWANGEILCNFELVFLIYLRNPRVQKANSLEQLFQLFFPTEMALVVDNYLFQCGGQNVVFLIDGFDEYPPELRKDSFILDIIMHKRLPESTVVVTSRPTATAALHNHVDKRVEILGFAEEDRKRYISESLASPGKEQELDKYLKQRPTINGLCFVPLHLKILLYLFQNDSLPETLTEMNESFILHTIYRYLERNTSEPRQVNKLADLPKAIHNIIDKLSALAFEGLQKNQLVFTQAEIENLFPVSKAVNRLGLLQVVEHYSYNRGAGTTTSFNFLHYTLQEFLAALHVSTLLSDQQLSLMKKTFWDGHYQFMWMMYVGIVGIESETFNNFISKGNKNKKGGVKLLSNIIKDKRKLLHLFQCYSEAKSNAKLPSIITSMFKNGEIKFNQTLLFPHNISSLTSFLSHSKVNLTVLELNNCHLGDVGMNFLKNFIVNNKELISTLRCINLLENNSSPWDVYCTIIEHCSIDSLTIFGDDGMEEYIGQFQNSLEKNTTLQSLTLLNIGKIGLQSIKTVLGNSKFLGLREMKLSWLDTDVETKVLLHTTFLLNSTLTCNSVNKEIAIKVIWDGTSNSLSDISMSSKLDGNIDILLFIAFGLQNNKTVCKLDLSNNSECLSTEEGMTIICDCLKSNNNTLKELKLSNNCIGDKVHMLGEALQVNKTLQNLDISNNNISDNDTRTNIKEVNNREHEPSGVSECLTSCNAVSVSTSQASMQEANIFHINKLNIASNNLSSTVISSYIKNNTRLQELDISENAITNEGAVEIAKAITTNSVLHKLNISKNYIRTEGLLCLIEIFIKAACPLKVLNVTRNNVTKSGFEKIESALKPSSSLKVYASWNEIVLENEQIWFKSIVFLFSDLQEVDDHSHIDNWSIKDIKDVDYRVKFLSDCLEEDITLHDLNLCNKNITGIRAKVVAKAIEVNATLRKLNISCNTLSDEGALAFSECLKYNRNLQELAISENNITNKGAIMIAEVMKINATLLKLDISTNWITSEAILYLLEAIKNKAVLKFLNITHNNVTKSEYINIQEYCKQVIVQVQASWNELELDSEFEFKTVRKVCNTDSDNEEIDYWPFKEISDPDARMEFLSNCLKENNIVQKLNLSNNDITDIGASLIGQAMEINRSLKILDISHNEFSDDGVTAISMYIRNNTFLQELDLSENKISDRGANEISDLIQYNKSLKVLDISCMCISDSGVTIISKYLENNRSLQMLNLSLNKITGIGAEKIAEALKKNITLQKLNITGNKISDDGAAAVSSCLEINSSLEELYMSESNISSEGAQHIAAAIQVNQCLHTLELHHHNVDDSLSFNNVILDAVFKNDTLKQLKLPWVVDKHENAIKDKEKKINKERIKRNIHTLNIT